MVNSKSATMFTFAQTALHVMATLQHALGLSM